MKRNYYNGNAGNASMRSIFLIAAICAIFLGYAYASAELDKGDMSLSSTNSSGSAIGTVNDQANIASEGSGPASLSQTDEEKLISGVGFGELLLTFTIKKELPVFSGRYSYDIAGIHVPPISTPVNVEGSRTGYSYSMPSVFIPGKPNNFTVTARGVKTLSIGLKELSGSGETNEIWKAEHPRAWVSTQAKADEKGTARIDSDLVSPSVYNAKIFGEAADNASKVDLTMTVVKKLVVNGPYNLSINTTGFPEGDYSFRLKSLNGTLGIDEMLIEM